MNLDVRLVHARQELVSVEITTSAGVVRARQAGSSLAATLGFGAVDQTKIATAISEIARNVLQHSGTVGHAKLWRDPDGRSGMLIEVDDHGCGIPDIAAAMRDGDSTAVASLGAGLRGSRCLMDVFEIHSAVGTGTLVRMIKWLPGPR